MNNLKERLSKIRQPLFFVPLPKFYFNTAQIKLIFKNLYLQVLKKTQIFAENILH